MTRTAPQHPDAHLTGPELGTPPSVGTRPEVPTVARGPIALLAAASLLALVATSGRYGYHRDELYFLAAGQRLAWGYPDQPLLTPLIARVTDLLAPGSLVVHRLPGALACAAGVLVTGLIARELGGGRRAQTIAAACAAVSATAIITGHFVTTTTYDIVLSAVLCWVVARALRTRDPRLLVPAGGVLGVGLLNKTLIGFLAAALVVGVVLAGPDSRRLLRSRWLAVGTALAVAGALPYLLWQAANGFPQLDMVEVIVDDEAQGGRVGFLPFQLLLVSPLLVPVWVAGLVRLARHPAARPFRGFAVMYAVLAVFYLATGGKAYYLCGAYPVLVAAGAVATDDWLGRAAGRGRARLRAGGLTAAIALSGVVAAVLGLGVLPVDRVAGSPVLAANPDLGETVGWPAVVGTVAAAYEQVPPDERGRTVVVTTNYGQAGAIDRYGRARGLPRAYSGHVGYADWGAPPDSATTTVLVGFREQSYRDRFFTGCRQAGLVDNGVDVDNEEQGAPVWLCSGLVRPWSQQWPALRRPG